MDAERQRDQRSADSAPSLKTPLGVSVRKQGVAAIVTLTGGIHFDQGDYLRQALLDTVNPPFVHTLLDLTDLRFVGSVGITCILATHRRARAVGGGVRLINPRAEIAKLLRLGHLDRLLPIHASVQEALDAISGP